MLIHLASYPRSGNSWIRRLLRNQFRYVNTPIHGNPVDQRENFRCGEWTLEGHFELIDYPPANDRDLFARYISVDPPGPEQLLLMPGNWKRLEDESFRQSLACSDYRFFVKTHLHPYRWYFAGERVIQPVRHPGAALWSYFIFLRDVRKMGISLEAVIEGDTGFGCWSRYHAAWEPVADTLDGQLLKVQYESLFGHELAFCQRLADLIDSPIRSEDLKPFSFYHERRPRVARCGRPDDWRAHFTASQMRLLEQRHGEQMQRLGYSACLRDHSSHKDTTE